MNKKLLTLATATTILLFANKGFSQEIADALKTKPSNNQTEQVNQELNDTLNYNIIDKKEFEEQKYKIMKKIGDKNSNKNNKNKKELEALFKQYLSNIEEQIIQNPEGRRRELEILYFDCEFADIQRPEKLKYLLGLSNSRVMN